MQLTFIEHQGLPLLHAHLHLSVPVRSNDLLADTLRHRISVVLLRLCAVVQVGEGRRQVQMMTACTCMYVCESMCECVCDHRV